MKSLLLMIVATLYLFVPMKESIHILQQNRYQLERYRNWLLEYGRQKQQKLWKTWCQLLPTVLLCLIADEVLAYRMLLLLLCIYAYLFYRNDLKVVYIKKIVYTHRAKRMFFIHALCNVGIWTVLYHILPWSIFLCSVSFLYFLPWIILLVSAAICEPMEEYIKASYVKDAKRILAQRPDLMNIAITGSYGKTSVKHILHTLLSQQYYTYMTPHSYNNLMGLTISIRTQLKTLHQVFIAEMGADHVGEIKRLAQFIHPTMAIITAVGPQHLSTFGSQENILKEKMQLVEHLPHHGIAILNYDNEWIRSYQVQHACTIITYGIHHDDVDVKAEQIVYSEQGSRFIVRCKDETFMVNTCLLGEHNVLNILAAIATARALHIKTELIIDGIKRLQYVEHRLEVRNMGLYTLLDDAYNSNPSGAAYALDVLSAMKGRRFLLTPGFLDLGDTKTKEHIAFAHKMKDCADEIILIGHKQTRDIYDTLVKEQFPLEYLHVCTSTKEAFLLLHQLVKKGDCALIENDLPDAFNY